MTGRYKKEKGPLYLVVKDYMEAMQTPTPAPPAELPWQSAPMYIDLSLSSVITNTVTPHSFVRERNVGTTQIYFTHLHRCVEEVAAAFYVADTEVCKAARLTDKDVSVHSRAHCY